MRRWAPFFLMPVLQVLASRMNKQQKQAKLPRGSFKEEAIQGERQAALLSLSCALLCCPHPRVVLADRPQTSTRPSPSGAFAITLATKSSHRSACPQAAGMCHAAQAFLFAALDHVYIYACQDHLESQRREQRVNRSHPALQEQGAATRTQGRKRRSVALSDFIATKCKGSTEEGGTSASACVTA